MAGRYRQGRWAGRAASRAAAAAGRAADPRAAGVTAAGPARIGWSLGMCPLTVHRVLARYGYVRLADVDRAAAAPVRQYERSRSGRATDGRNRPKAGSAVIPSRAMPTSTLC